ncbi:MAG: hypothetical protein A2381_13790 [Bdellovibrionales bacterium RIFOXYB1_FULL_37_110]|nr:MAG: hypothetical protein A2417_05425 [Bdellovibrionales bacterium RIFOXYC1_FULL_37_79]OFZ56932.1 MAG: hypothetical protein A2381_13790 [Bdellovibrionales bacterium RIFOXYB1_FULL_37_110]OFZ62019.1 MAG: hypothetical protein A2577_19260 [Bdellovibrionales bacterium RIFOXYD1_FULL_36_51]
MLNTFYGIETQFLYGNTCEEIPKSEVPEVAKRKQTNVDVNRVRIKIDPQENVAVICAYPITPYVSSSPKKKAVYKYSLSWQKELKQIRQFFKFTQDDLAEILKVSKSTIQKIEYGDTKKPYDNTIERFEAILELKRTVSEKFKNKKYAIRALLNEKLTVFGEKSAIETLKNGDEETIFFVLATFKRM